jgi:protein-disulfide isomerase
MSSKQSRTSATKKQTRAEERRKKEQQKRLRLVLYILGVVVLVALAAWALNSSINKTKAASLGEIVKITPVVRPQADRNNMGDPNAKVKIVEYSDFQCPYCKVFADETLQAIVDAYISTGKVYFTTRSMGNFVSQNIGPNGVESRDAAEAAYCAADQGKYWEFSEAAFANWEGEEVGSFSSGRLNEIAQSLNLDMNLFKDCMKSHAYRNQVNQDYSDGRAAGINSTPSFLINGKVISGALPFSDFQAEIEAALAAAGN